DIVVAINGQPTATALAKVEERVSGATPQWIRWRSLLFLAAGKENSELRLTIRHGQGAPRGITLQRTVTAEQFFDKTKKKLPAVGEVKPGIWYVDIDRVTEKEFAAVVPKLEKASGIVFDLRGYPTIWTTPLAHLTDKTITCAQWHIPVV